MIRYIRTKDGKIYDTEKYAYAWSTPQKIGLNISITESLLIPKSLIEKQADAIEELCDEFVIYDIHKKKWLHFTGLKSLVAYCDMNGLDKTMIKGAIWTDKGLIYVAKMNDEGNLELI